MVQRLSGTFVVTTPLFGGGAAPTISAELRPPSIKGVFRFWWRAFAWSRHPGDLAGIRADEARIFGAPGDGKVGGQADFLLRVHSSVLPQPLSPPNVLTYPDDGTIGVGARYFGYGLMEAFDRFDEKEQKQKKAGELTRPCLEAPLEFTVELMNRASFDPTVIDALTLMGLLGGLGSRTRRGWGSLTLTSLTQDGAPIWQAPTDIKGYRQAVRDILCRKSLPFGEPPYSAFSNQTRIDIVGKDSDPLRLLNTVGEQMLRYRSWGRTDRHGVHKVGDVEVQRNFEDDHDWFKASERGANIATGRPRRAIFGLPHNYSQRFHITATSYDRRASPLLIHVHRLADQSYIAVLTVLRSEFLPTGKQLKVTNGRAEGYRDAAPDWSVLNGFIDGTSKKSKKPYFPSRSKVLP